MRIEADLKLGFKDVLIRPKRSTLGSRAQVSLERTFRFRHTGRTWTRHSDHGGEHGYRRHFCHGYGIGATRVIYRGA